jgi:chitodextrinase
VGVTAYRIERCQGVGCTTFAEIGTSTTSTYSNLALTASTSYSYRVRATDAAGNLSGYSNISTAMTAAPADTQPPSDPIGLVASAASSAQINLTWTGSTDNVGVTAYRIERCQGVGCTTWGEIATPGPTAYSDTGLTAGTSYSYRVRAGDAAGNLSGYSNVATTFTTGGTPPPIAFRQVNSAVPQTPQTTVTVPFTGAQTGGDLNLVAIGWSTPSAQVTGVTDTAGNTYVVAAAPTVQTGVQAHVIFVAPNIGPAAANANAVTVSFNAAVAYPDVRIAEYGGLATINPVEAAGGGSGNRDDRRQWHDYDNKRECVARGRRLRDVDHDGSRRRLHVAHGHVTR